MDELRSRDPRRLLRVARRTTAAAAAVVAVALLTGSAVVAAPVDLLWLQPAVWPTLSESDDPNVNCGIDGPADPGACLIDGGATVVVSSGIPADQSQYLALLEVGAAAFAETGANWDSCDLDAWAAVHGASKASISRYSDAVCD